LKTANPGVGSFFDKLVRQVSKKAVIASLTGYLVIAYS